VTAAFVLAALASGAVIGLILGLIGGGGSILAVPLIVFAVGVESPHEAIGTAAIAVALNALIGLSGHWRAGTVKWRCGTVFAVAGVSGALIGAEMGKAFDGQRLLALFGALMIVIGLLMFRKRRTAPAPDVRLSLDSAARLLPRLVPIGAGTGLLAGFFGIGGGFLIVPGLMLATAMPLANAIGTSLVAVSAFGLATAGSYAVSGLIDWPLAALLVTGGAAGSWLGIRAGKALAPRKRLLEQGFAAVVVLVGIYVVVRAA
jgi:LPXTG-motif cell wall-anchored protein